jgi:K+-sensing histidine kinase KdpD
VTAKVDVMRALCVSTADTGIGIPPDAQRQIFEPFEQEACVDWSEQMEHLGGVLAAALLDHALEARWVKCHAGRVIEVSAVDKAAFASVLGAP